MDVHISLAMMVKNEEKTILKSFESCKPIISSLYIYDTGSDDETLNIIKQFENENPQISVNAGVGAFYPIYGGFNLYGKIGGSYYFDAKNAEKTIYSDKKIVLDLNAGIRFDF